MPQDLDVLALCCRLKDLYQDNKEHFSNDKSAAGQQLFCTLSRILEELDTVQNLVKEVQSFVHEYDFDESVPGNGYRSFVHVTKCALQHMLVLGNKLSESRNSFWFRKSWYAREFELYEALLISVRTCLKYLLLLREWSDAGDLFPSKPNSAAVLFGQDEPIYQACFYGKCLGFQYCGSIQKVLKFISSCMAGFSQLYFSKSHFIFGVIKSFIYGGICLLSPNVRAVRLVDLIQDAQVGFCKAFWLLAEGKFMQLYTSIVSATVAVNRRVEIPPQPLSADCLDGGGTVNISIPSSHFGPLAISTRLISLKKRKGMLGVNANDPELHPPSNSIIIHCHGGGFIAQSSTSHQVYTRDWAAKLDVPILSIDYSLAPGAPYPRALEEVFYIYCWVLRNCKLLGSTGGQIILAGDSAGSNLNFGTTIKCMQYRIRKPDGLFIVYCPFYVKFAPSPARLLCLMDPLLPFGFMMRCLKAYVLPTDSITKQNAERVKSMEILVNSAYHTNTDKKIVENGRNLTKCKNHTNPTSWTAKFVDTARLFNKFKRDILRFLSQPSCLIDLHLSAKPISESKTEEIENMRWRKRNCDMKSILFEDPTKEFDFKVPPDHFISPYLADENVLRQLPTIKILSVDMDPCLDDCVMLAKKLKILGVNVTLDVIGGLPHGFLNLVKVSKEADEGSDRCVQLLKGILQQIESKVTA